MIPSQSPMPGPSKPPHDILSIGKALPVALAMRQRIDYAMPVLETEWRAGKRVCALACGKLREADSLAGCDLTNITAVDRNPQSLEHVWRLHEGRIALFDANVLQYLDRASRGGERFDFIYALGLADFLDDRGLLLLHWLMRECLSPGGKILIANLARDAGRSDWEFGASDWTVARRDESDLARFAHEIGLEPTCWRDPAGAVVFCEMISPA